MCGDNTVRTEQYTSCLKEAATPSLDECGQNKRTRKLKYASAPTYTCVFANCIGDSRAALCKCDTLHIPCTKKYKSLEPIWKRTKFSNRLGNRLSCPCLLSLVVWT